VPTDSLELRLRLRDFCRAQRRLLVLTGAGCSTASGIPAYRDHTGEWRHPQPMRFEEFSRSAAARRRYWARSAAGWTRIATARPNAAHHALARLEGLGRIQAIVTQNVDGLHSKAGSRRVIDLHGRLDRVRCLDCGARSTRAALQDRLRALNPRWRAAGHAGPDGDQQLTDRACDGFQVPDCEHCGGRLKPDVVFFGEAIPRPRLAAALRSLDRADALLVVGSSLMVFSGFRFVRDARQRGLPVAAVTLGRTRADELLDLKLSADCCDALAWLADELDAAALAEA